LVTLEEKNSTQLPILAKNTVGKNLNTILLHAEATLEARKEFSIKISKRKMSI
jgi:hypothetical protein